VVAGDRRSEHGDEFLPGQTVGEVVVDRGHDGVVQDVDIQMDPEPSGTVLAFQVGEGVAGCPPGLEQRLSAVLVGQRRRRHHDRGNP
jgi:hypothetical protein